MTFTLTQAAEELKMSERWLRGWLSDNPVDAKGVPFYIPIGRRKEFEPADIERIRARIREIEQCRLSSTARPARPSGITGAQLGRLAAGKGFAERVTPQKKTTPRAKLPNSQSDTGTVVSMVREQS